VLVSMLDHAQRGGSSNDNDHPDDLCPICMATAAMGNAVAPMPPVLPVAFAYAMVDRQIEPVVVVVQPQQPAFQSRGPPIS
jgi:hypothetical protein